MKSLDVFVISSLVIVFGCAVFMSVSAIMARCSCYVSPLGGVPVDVHVVNNEPFVCGWTADGYRCRKMEPCR